MTKLIIFDLDGTLINTIDDLGNATNYALEQLGFKTQKREAFFTLCGKGIFNMFNDALEEKDRTQENIDKMTELFLPFYDEHCCDKTTVYNGLNEVLTELQDKGLKFAIATNKYQEGAEKLVKHFFPNINFVKILGQRDGHPIKPNPEVVEDILKECPNISKEEVVYIGDTNVDMQTGINAGITTVGVSWGFREIAELQAFNPAIIVNNAQEFKDFILNR